MRATTTQSVLPSASKAVTSRRRAKEEVEWPTSSSSLEYDTLIRPSGFLGHGSTKGGNTQDEARSFLHYPHVRPRHRATILLLLLLLLLLLRTVSPSTWWRRGPYAFRGGCSQRSVRFHERTIFRPRGETRAASRRSLFRGRRWRARDRATSINCFGLRWLCRTWIGIIVESEDVWFFLSKNLEGEWLAINKRETDADGLVICFVYYRCCYYYYYYWKFWDCWKFEIFQEIFEYFALKRRVEIVGGDSDCAFVRWSENTLMRDHMRVQWLLEDCSLSRW